MKNKLLPALVVMFSFLLTGHLTFAQQNREAEIRNLESRERDAVLKSDSAILYNKLWSPNMVIHTPANRVGTVEGTKMQLRTGKLNYLSFERAIEKITFNDNLAIVRTCLGIEKG